METKKYLTILSLGLVMILLISSFGCGKKKKPEIADSDQIQQGTTEFDELFNASKEGTKSTQDEEADVLKLLGINQQEKVPEKQEQAPPVQETQPIPIATEEVTKLESEIDDKNKEIQELSSALNGERQKVYDLQSQLDAERTRAKTVENLAPTGSGFSEQYESGLNEYKARRYRAAINKFEQLLATNPTNNLADNCQYWIGESYYGLGEYTKAIAAFEKVFSFSNSNKNDDSQLKLGMCYWRLNETGRAKEEFDRLLSHYPDSEYATIARKYLSKL
jgi:tol-pal system protein YbgF